MAKKKACCKDVFRCGLQQLEKRGWTQGTLMDLDGSVCAIGALDEGRTQLMDAGYKGVDKAYDLACNKLMKKLDHYTTKEERAALGNEGEKFSYQGDIAEWNDSKHRTKRDVVKAFKAAQRSC